MLRVTNSVSQNEDLSNLAATYGNYKLNEQIACLLVKQKAGKEQHPLLQKGMPVKPLQ
jgi:hypothetical protein